MQVVLNEKKIQKILKNIQITGAVWTGVILKSRLWPYESSSDRSKEE